MRRGLKMVVGVVAVMAISSGFARMALAQAVVADLSDHLIAVTTGFSGTKLLLFGAIDGD